MEARPYTKLFVWFFFKAFPSRRPLKQKSEINRAYAGHEPRWDLIDILVNSVSLFLSSWSAKCPDQRLPFLLFFNLSQICQDIEPKRNDTLKWWIRFSKENTSYICQQKKNKENDELSGQNQKRSHLWCWNYQVILMIWKKRLKSATTRCMPFFCLWHLPDRASLTPPSFPMNRRSWEPFMHYSQTLMLTQQDPVSHTFSWISITLIGVWGLEYVSKTMQVILIP